MIKEIFYKIEARLLKVTRADKLGVSFTRSVMKLSFGTAISQIIMVLGYIILARIYTPAQFGLVAFILGLAAVFMPIMTLRLEMTTLIEKHYAIAKSALALCFLLLCLFIIPITLSVQIFFTQQHPEYLSVLLYFAIILFSQSFLLVADFFFNRLKKFKIMATLPICQSFGVIIASVIFMNSPLGLLWGHLFGICFTSLLGIIILRKEILSGLKILSLKRASFIFKKNKDFVLFSTPASFINASATNLPIILFQGFFGAVSVGLYSMMIKFMWAPVKLISAAINKVAINKISDHINKNQPIFPLMRNISFFVSILSFILCSAIITFCLLDGFTFLLGDQWQQINVLALLFVPALLIVFIAKSSSRFAIFRQNKLGLYYQTTSLAVIASTLYGSFAMGADFNTSVFMLSMALAILSLCQISLFWFIAYKHDQKLLIKS